MLTRAHNVTTSNYVQDDDHLNRFNNAVNAVNDFLSDNCPAWNACLTTAAYKPSNRTTSCVVQSPAPVPVCANVTWDPINPVACSFTDASGGRADGICDPNGAWYDWNNVYHQPTDHPHSYATYASFKGAIAKVKQAMNKFYEDPSIEYFNAFNQLHDVRAVVAYAKASMLYISMQQQLIMLGNPDNDNATMMAFANRTANWLQTRYDYHASMLV